MGAYETVLHEIAAVRAENGLGQIEVERSTPLEDLGFDSLMYTVLVTRIEEKLGSPAFAGSDEAIVLPVIVGDMVDLFGAPSSG